MYYSKINCSKSFVKFIKKMCCGPNFIYEIAF